MDFKGGFQAHRTSEHNRSDHEHDRPRQAWQQASDSEHWKQFHGVCSANKMRSREGLNRVIIVITVLFRPLFWPVVNAFSTWNRHRFVHFRCLETSCDFLPKFTHYSFLRLVYFMLSLSEAMGTCVGAYANLRSPLQCSAGDEEHLWLKHRNRFSPVWPPRQVGKKLCFLLCGSIDKPS